MQRQKDAGVRGQVADIMLCDFAVGGAHQGPAGGHSVQESNGPRHLSRMAQQHTRQSGSSDQKSTISRAREVEEGEDRLCHRL